jgi:hypothetical protein
MSSPGFHNLMGRMACSTPRSGPSCLFSSRAHLIPATASVENGCAESRICVFASPAHIYKIEKDNPEMLGGIA